MHKLEERSIDSKGDEYRSELREFDWRFGRHGASQWKVAVPMLHRGGDILRIIPLISGKHPDPDTRTCGTTGRSSTGAGSSGIEWEKKNVVSTTSSLVEFEEISRLYSKEKFRAARNLHGWSTDDLAAVSISTSRSIKLLKISAG